MSYLKKSLKEFYLINRITELMENNDIEFALAIIYKVFDNLSVLEKKLLVLNIIEATNQYDIMPYRLPDSYFDFLASDESNDLFGL